MWIWPGTRPPATRRRRCRRVLVIRRLLFPLVPTRRGRGRAQEPSAQPRPRPRRQPSCRGGSPSSSAFLLPPGGGAGKSELPSSSVTLQWRPAGAGAAAAAQDSSRSSPSACPGGAAVMQPPAPPQSTAGSHSRLHPLLPQPPSPAHGGRSFGGSGRRSTSTMRRCSRGVPGGAAKRRRLPPGDDGFRQRRAVPSGWAREAASFLGKVGPAWGSGGPLPRLIWRNRAPPQPSRTG
ncbi:hypothetical protein PVAP13_1NG479300 [Panicum virgatum]|uniref:Uncharacterized protein n=1 Tax=Panicum virgatum TaxID=38727 RepID=A0A8T0X6T4_PANVG|nr:hypothetical protein PVAP13_1NG479300 [Panicum virgatum]